MPAPPPPPPPPPPISASRPSVSASSVSEGRGALLASIRTGCRLKSVQTSDRSSNSSGVGRIVPSQSNRPSSVATTSSRASFLHVPVSGKSTSVAPSVEENTNYSLPSSPQCAGSAVSSSALSRGGVGRRSRVCTKPTAPPPPPPISVAPSLSTASIDSTVSSVFSRLQPSVARAQSMRSPAEVSSSCLSAHSPGVSWSRGGGSSAGAHQDPVSSASTSAVVRTAPPRPGLTCSSPVDQGRRLSHPVKPAPPPPPAFHHRSSLSSLAGARPADVRPPVVCVQSCQPPPLPIRNSSLTSTSITSSRTNLSTDSRIGTASCLTSTSSRSSLAASPRTSTTSAPSLPVGRRQSLSESNPDGSNDAVFVDRYLSCFAPVSSLPTPPRLTNCVKLYPSRRNTVRRARAPPPPPLPAPNVGSNLVR